MTAQASQAFFIALQKLLPVGLAEWLFTDGTLGNGKLLEHRALLFNGIGFHFVTGERLFVAVDNRAQTFQSAFYLGAFGR